MKQKHGPTALMLLPSFPQQARTGGEMYNRYVVEGLTGLGLPVVVISLQDLIGQEALHDRRMRKTAKRAISSALEPYCSEGATVIYDSWLYRFLFPLMVWKRVRGNLRLVSFSQLCYWDTYASTPLRLLHRLKTMAALVPAHHHVGVSEAVLHADLGLFYRRKNTTVICPASDFAGRNLIQARCATMPAKLVSVGNYTKRKGFHVLIGALALVFESHPELKGQVVLHLAGNLSFDPGYVDRLRTLIEEKHLAQSVIMDDWKGRDAISALFSESQLFVFASESEGFGMVVLEAMLHGLPVLLGDFMTAEELLGASHAGGYIVPSRLEQGYAQCIIDYLLDDNRSQRGELSRARALEFSQSWADVVEKFHQVLV
ncbi:MAG: glycosyltransferase family 4 protein [Sphaerochaeta sp.]|nr:glycosyltransferase family 4 protein [Sphaerochaeta sp.]